MKLLLLLGTCALAAAGGGGGPWDRIGPWNIFDGVDEAGNPTGEAGTLACAASPAAHPEVIYAGGQNNGVSSGVIKTVDGGKTWTRKSNGLWDTAVLGTWVHPDDASGNHVLCGTHSGIYESRDGAETWTFRNETTGWGNVMSFRRGVIGGQPYVLANSGNGILTQPLSGGTWQRIASPGGIAPNAHLSVVETDGVTEVLTCIGGWGGGDLYYAKLTSASNATWTGPIRTANKTFPTWEFFPGQSGIYAKCQTPTQCSDGITALGKFDTLEACQAAVNKTAAGADADADADAVAWYTYQHAVSSLGDYAGMCYVGTAAAPFAPTAQPNVDSGRAPGVFPGQPIDCANAAVDPQDRDHFLYSKGGQYRAWESYDGGKTVNMIVNNTHGVYFVMIDAKGWYFTATQDGAFVSTDKGATWNALHVVMHTRTGNRTIDRVPHDYQRIVPDFRGDEIAFPSDQGLHIFNRSDTTGYRLISAIGDMRNTMSLSALLAPNAEGSRNLIVNLWDWDVGASFNDGKTWAGWNATEQSPGSCGEGGGGQGMGASGYMIMYHHNHWYQSKDGGHNFMRGDLPGTGGSFAYARKAGSRSEPSGTCFSVLSAPAPPPPTPPTPAPTPPPPTPVPAPAGGWQFIQDQGLQCAGDEFRGDLGATNGAGACLAAVQAKESSTPLNYAIWRGDSGSTGHCYCCQLNVTARGPAATWQYGTIKGAVSIAFTGASSTLQRRGAAKFAPYDPMYKHPKKGTKTKKEKKQPYTYTPGTRDPVNGNINYLMTSEDFGNNWTWTPFPDDFQASYLVCDPTDPSKLYGLTSSCLRSSTDKGATWSACNAGTGLTGSLNKLLVKDKNTLFLLRGGGKVPLRSRDAGASWQELTAAAPLFQYGASFDGSISWSGKTLVLSGFDGSAIGRGARGTSVWKSSDDGDTWSDETGDVVTNSPGPGVWYDRDFYFVTRGEGVLVKRNFEA